VAEIPPVEAANAAENRVIVAPDAKHVRGITVLTMDFEGGQEDIEIMISKSQ
jgi:hypothetical protein